MAQSAIDLLFEQFDVLNSDSSIPVSVVLNPEDWAKLYIKFKAMEKEQMRKCASFWRGKENEIEKQIFDQYYKDTYNK